MEPLTFSKNPRSRRSRPFLGALHVTPLTIEPLGAPALLSHPDDPNSLRNQHTTYLSSRSLPPTPGILSRSSSRAHSRSRTAKSALALTSLDDYDASHGAGTMNAYPRTPGGTRSTNRPKSALASGRQTPGRVRIADGSAQSTEFLLRTASLLVENASESKGQGWISKRNSSTSLVGGYDGLVGGQEGSGVYAADDEYSPSWSRVDPGSARASRRASRGHASVGSAGSSQWASRRASRAELQSAARTPGISTPREGYFEGMELEFADEDDDIEDEEEIDEGELRRLLRRRVGGFFVDIFGGWSDFRGEEDDPEDVEETEAQLSEEADTKKQTTERLRRKLQFAEVKKGDLVDMRPPADTGGVLSDAKWLVDLARRSLI